MSIQNVASIKARLMNQSRERGKTMQEMLTASGLERTIYRLSVSKYKDNFTLKGGIFLYGIFHGDFVRATTDIDLLADDISNNIEKMRAVFTEIFSLKTDDPLQFDLDSLQVRSITEFKEYHGVNVSIMSYLDRTRIPVSIDIGFGDIIYPDRIEMDFPVILSDECPVVYAYSLYSCVAEKFEAIVSLGYENSRFKDYYDLYVLARNNYFNGDDLTEAIKETFEHRNTSFDDIVAFEEGFSDDVLRQSRWNAFVKKKKPMIKITLQDSIDMIRKFIEPIVLNLQENKKFTLQWNPRIQKWE